LNGDFFLNTQTVFPDGRKDQLIGGEATDWFFIKFGEDQGDQQPEELTTQL
jgi:hypothetical protein